jgi:hypothetical protein
MPRDMPSATAFTFPPPPRRVRRRGGTGCAVAFPRFFIMPHVIAGIVMLLAVPVRLYVYNRGTPVKAIIHHIEPRTSRKGGDFYVIGYHYVLNGRRYDDENESLTVAEGRRTKFGDTIDGRAAAFLGQAKFMRLSEGNNGTWRLLVFALLWNGVVGVFVYITWVMPIRDRRLVRSGTATPGVITGSKESRRRGVSHTISYEFVTADGQMFTGTQDVSKRAWEIPEDGAVITVIFDTCRPQQRSLVYELSDYIVSGPLVR